MRRTLIAVLAGSLLAGATPATAAWVSTGSGSARAKAGSWTLRWTNPTGPSGSTCVAAATCTASIGKNTNFVTTVELTDSSGRVLSGLGVAQTVTISVSQTSGGAFTQPTSGSSVTLTLPATGQAITTASFTYRTGNANTFTDVLTAASPSYPSATATLTK